MLKALIKKQFQELLSFLFRGGYNGKRRSKTGTVLYGLLMMYVLVVMFSLFYIMMRQICAPLAQANLSWLYFALTGIMATALGVVGSVLMAQSMLFEAKDNEFLLSMPIPPSKILLSRMTALYLQTAVFEALVLLPAGVVYWQTEGISAISVILYAAIMALLPLLGVTLSCILGWLVALAASRMRNKSLITVLLSLALLGGYFYLYSQLNYYLQLLLTNGEAIGRQIQAAVYPLYQMGLAALGDGLAFGIFAGFVLVIFAMVYAVLSKSFLKIATTRKGAVKVRYKEKTLKVSSIRQALLQREIRHFLKSPVYMMNCGLGAIFLIAGAVLAIVKSDWILNLTGQLTGLGEVLPLLVCLTVCLIASLNMITAPSVSLEGKAVWFIQSLPVSSWQVLKSKLHLHMMITAVPALLCSIALNVILRPSVEIALLTTLAPIVWILFCGLIGLALNLKFPNLDWSSETIAVKQGVSVVLAMFISWGALLALAGLYWALAAAVGEAAFLVLSIGVLGAGSWALSYWLKKRGTRIFETIT